MSDVIAAIWRSGASPYAIWDHQGDCNGDNGEDDNSEDDDDICMFNRHTSAFNGLSVNGDWSLLVWDDCPGNTGQIDFFGLRIFYKGDCQIDEDCSPMDECTVPRCDAGNCQRDYHSRPYGDVFPFEGITPPCTSADRAAMGDGFANMLDVFCAFNAFNDGFPSAACPCADVSPFAGDSFVNMQDVFAIFSAFNDDPACSAPCR